MKIRKIPKPIIKVTPGGNIFKRRADQINEALRFKKKSAKKSLKRK